MVAGSGIAPETRAYETLEILLLQPAIDITYYIFGALNEIRTRVPAVKGRCPRPLDDESKYLARRRGLEPLASDVTGRRSNQLS